MSKTYGLAIHTSSPDLGLAINNFDGDSRCCTWNLGQNLSSQFHQYLAEFLLPQTWSDLAWLAVAKGPGGFTGTRIGVVAARTLAQQLNIPLYAISSLAAFAWEHRDQTLNHQIIAVQMPAQRGQLFTAIYMITRENYDQEIRQKLNQLAISITLSDPDSNNPTVIIDEDQQFICLLPDQVMSPGAWELILSQLAIADDQLLTITGGCGKSAKSLLELAYPQWQQGKRNEWLQALPFYGQHPVDH